MQTLKTITIIMLAVLATMTAGCHSDTRKSRIEASVREYIEPTLGENEEFCFIGIYAPKEFEDNGVTRVRVGVIYSIRDNATDGTCLYDCTAVMTTDYRTLISLRESGHDTIEEVTKKVKKEFSNALKELMK